MESPLLASPVMGPFTRSRSNTKLDDVSSLTSFNPFAEEDENDQSSYTLVTTLFSRMKNSLAPLSYASAVSSGPPSSSTTTNPPLGNANPVPGNSEARRASQSGAPASSAGNLSRTSSTDRPFSIKTTARGAAPPLVSLTPVQSEAPTYLADPYERSSSRGSVPHTPLYESPDSGMFGTAIPGFPIQDDARSIRTVGSLQRSESVSKVIRRIRGEGLSRDYWMDDNSAKECYDCKSEFSAWRRKHHCRICGQIFCSRCASNIISGSRFGHDGMIRVCNLCLGKLGKVEDDDDDDRRSMISSATSFPAHQLGADTSGLVPQSPFAASQLFGRTAEPFNLYSIAETRRPRSFSESSHFPSRPITPLLREMEDGTWEEDVPLTDEPVPFRRRLSEDKEVLDLRFDGQESPIQPEMHKSESQISFPRMGEGFTSSIQFPVGSPERLDSPRSISRMRNRFDSFDADTMPSPFIRSRVHSRLDSLVIGEPGWRERRESTAYAQELNLISMHHLKVMLRQMLVSENIPNVKQWEDTLLKIALRISKDLTFTAPTHRQGNEDMDVRHYVKIKKLPGGTPFDSEYVDGVVVTKNVAHKQMSRSQRNARVMLVTFPLEFQRVEGQYMHFGQIFRQEREYLGNLASRIAALRPHIVLVEKSVSRLALDALAKHNVAVARAVKPSVIKIVARITQADIFSSMDKLALEPRLGHCLRYRLQSFDHPLIPGRRKTYMRFEGCPKDLGCTIILRGENIDVLRRLKKVTRFLTFVVRNLKLETHLWKDSVITLPPLHPDTMPPSLSQSHSSVQSDHRRTPIPSVVVSTPVIDQEPSTPSDENGDLPDEDAERLRLSRAIQQSLEPYQTTLISISSTLRFPPPHPIRRMKELDDELTLTQRTWEDEVVRREEISRNLADSHESLRTPMPLAPSPEPPPQEQAAPDAEDIKAQIEALPLASPLSPMSPGALSLDNSGGYFARPTTSSAFPGVGTLTTAESTVTTSPSSMEPPVVKTIADISLESQLDYVRWQHEEQQRIWKWYSRKNKDDFVVEKYQCISWREFFIPMSDSGLDKACAPPQIKYINFYGEGDCTLGQFIERSVEETLAQFLDPKAICTAKGCDQPMARHCRVFVHHESRLFVAVEQWDGQIIGRNLVPAPELITTWSACRICGAATPFIPVSEEMERYSFGKFLELHFYPADVKIVQGAGCQHNIYRHHVRYFARRGMTVRFQADPITLFEIISPPIRIRVRTETKLELKNLDYERLLTRNNMWYSALIDDLKLISIDAATGDEETDGPLFADIKRLIARAEIEREAITQFIYQIYRDSSPTDTLALNQVHAYRQDKIVAWQQDFDKLPRPKAAPAVDRTSKRMSSAFGSVRAMWPRRYDLVGGYPSSSMSEAEESPLSTGRRGTGDSLNSSASEASEPENGLPGDEDPASLPLAEQLPPHVHVTIPIPEVDGDPDSDSTIAATQDEAAPKSAVEALKAIASGSPERPADSKDSEASASEPAVATTSQAAPRPSKLPRRIATQPTVAELVRKYQDWLPANGMHELAKDAMAPSVPVQPSVVSESEQEYPSLQLRRPSRPKGRPSMLVKKGSVSDFESSYAANIAPRYLTTSARRPPPSRARGPQGNRIESQDSSRRTSPEKRPVAPGTQLPRPSSPHEPTFGSAFGPGRSRIKGYPRTPANKDRAASRTGDKPGRSTFRRPTPVAPGSKVSNIAKHFERLGRDAERTNRRYVVIRGKRARPVASARAKVEVLDSVKDAIDDSEESSSSSSEADDEGDDNEEEPSPTRPRTDPSPPLSVDPPPEPITPAIMVQGSSPLVQPVELPQEHTATAEESPQRPVSPDSQSLVLAPPPPHPGPISLPPSPFFSSFKIGQNLPLTPLVSDMEGGERHSILKAISGFLLQQPSSRSSEYDDPMNDPEHIFRDSSMIVRTDEPTSIIALALNSPQYRELLLNSRSEKRSRGAELGDSEAFMPDDRSIAESTSTWGVVNVDAADLADPTEDLKVPSSKLPWAITFESGGLTISCTILYPEQFDAIRRTYGCEKSIIESLARCAKWNNNGGKSGSAFLKTLDDRFIAKELSRPELLAMETFAPAYFDYMSSAMNANRPVLLAKVLGCYKLTFKKTAKDKSSGKSKSTQMNLVVMENLFYDRRFSKIYDLKGSTRNRHVQSTGRENEVLLDENLIQTAHLAPFYLREHSKRILRGSLYSDTKFLEDINVMDYSLVVGVDSQKNELVTGIVDYIRTYTWDKKLENLVKESTFLGAAAKGEGPTIITPKLYRHRFLTSMERYFPLVPDRWMKQKDCPEIEAEHPTADW